MNDQLEIEGDMREALMEEHAESSFEENLSTPEEIAEFESWLEVDDPMDGDHESALASAGFGTDEDYGSFGDE